MATLEIRNHNARSIALSGPRVEADGHLRHSRFIALRMTRDPRALAVILRTKRVRPGE